MSMIKYTDDILTVFITNLICSTNGLYKDKYSRLYYKYIENDHGEFMGDLSTLESLIFAQLVMLSEGLEE
jgi:hypothetical protein